MRLVNADKLVDLELGEVIGVLTSGEPDYNPEQVVEDVEQLMEEYEIDLPSDCRRRLHRIIRNGGDER